MTLGADVLDLPVVELSARLERGELTSVALTEGYLARIARVAPALNCFVSVTPERARADARRADDERAGGRRGPLLGIPYALKDVIDTAGIATTWGTRALLGRIPERDATVEARLRAAGAVLLGKLSLTELANAFGNAYPVDNHNGACRNPWDRTRWAGGSSSGSGAAVASGLCAFALGTETAGSIDVPAAFCGVVGYRPTYDLVPRDGVMTLSWSLDKVGVFCRDARDVRVVLPVLADDPKLDRTAPQLRIGVVDTMAEPPPDPQNAALWDAAKRTLRDAGIVLVPVSLPELPRGDALTAILETDIFVALEPFIRSGGAQQMYKRQPWPEIAAEFEARGIRSTDYVKAMLVRSQLQHAYQKLFDQVDAIATFGVAVSPQKVEYKLESNAKPGGRAVVGIDGNLAGLPAITVPTGFASDGMPRSLHVVAAPYADHVLIAIAERYQARTEFHRRRPPE